MSEIAKQLARISRPDAAKALGYADDVFYRGEATGKLPNSYPGGGFFSRDPDVAGGFAGRGGQAAPREFRLNLQNAFRDGEPVTAAALQRVLAGGGDDAFARNVVDMVAPGKDPTWFAGFAQHRPDKVVMETGGHLRQMIERAHSNSPEAVFKAAGFDAIVGGRDVQKLGGDGIRLANAAFDPARAKSRNIMAGIGGLGIAGGALALGSGSAEASEQRDVQPNDDIIKALIRGKRGASGMDMSSMHGFGVDPNEEEHGDGTADALMRGLAGFGLSAADPFSIPSAVTGMVSPETRDAWRQGQQEGGIAPMLAGQIVSGGGAAGAIMKGAGGVFQAGARMAPTMAASDVIDEYGGGKDDAVGMGTIAKALMGGVAGASFPTQMGAGGAALFGPQALGVGSAQAQDTDDGIRLQLDRLPVSERRALQRMLGVKEDGQIGATTVTAERERRARVKAEADAKLQVDRDRVKGESDAAIEAARARGLGEAEAAKIRAQAEAEGIRARQASDQRGADARKPFREQNPELSNALPLAGAAGAFAIPLIAQALLRRGETSGLRRAAQEVNRSVPKANTSLDDFVAGQADAARTGVDLNAAKGAIEGWNKAQGSGVAARSTTGHMMDAGSLTAAAALPSLGAMTPELMDFAAGGERRENAKKEFTFDNMMGRLMGPGAAGLALAGVGRVGGGLGSYAFMNPAPKAGLVSQGDALARVTSAGLDDVTTANSRQTGASVDAASGLRDRRAVAASEERLGAEARRLDLEAMQRLRGSDLLAGAKGDEVRDAATAGLNGRLLGNPRQSRPALPAPNGSPTNTQTQPPIGGKSGASDTPEGDNTDIIRALMATGRGSQAAMDDLQTAIGNRMQAIEQAVREGTISQAQGQAALNATIREGMEKLGQKPIPPEPQGPQPPDPPTGPSVFNTMGTGRKAPYVNQGYHDANIAAVRDLAKNGRLNLEEGGLTEGQLTQLQQQYLRPGMSSQKMSTQRERVENLRAGLREMNPGVPLSNVSDDMIDAFLKKQNAGQRILFSGPGLALGAAAGADALMDDPNSDIIRALMGSY